MTSDSQTHTQTHTDTHTHTYTHTHSLSLSADCKLVIIIDAVNQFCRTNRITDVTAWLPAKMNLDNIKVGAEHDVK